VKKGQKKEGELVRKERSKERERRGKNTRDVGTKKKSIVIVVGRGESSRQPVHAIRQRERPIFPHFTVKL
jgi:hypothetical protein